MTKKPEFLTAENLKQSNEVRHAFFTRQGGYSKGIYSSLNCGVGSNDNIDDVKKNRMAILDTICGDENAKLYTLHQIHSNKVAVISKESDDNERQQADALVTNLPDVVLGILTADCTPVLFADDKAKIVGAAHAGWKGAFSGVLENTVDEMLKLGATRKNIKAAIGPTIQQESYEVDSSFYDHFIQQSIDNAEFFIKSKKENHFMFDLPAYVLRRLEKLNLTSIDNLAVDTYKNEDKFFSWRRTFHQGGTDYGRLLSAIRLENNIHPKA